LPGHLAAGDLEISSSVRWLMISTNRTRCRRRGTRGLQHSLLREVGITSDQLADAVSEILVIGHARIIV